MFGTGPGLTGISFFDARELPLIITLTGGATDVATALGARSGAPTKARGYRLLGASAVSLAVTDGAGNSATWTHQPGEGYEIATGITSIVGAAATVVLVTY